MDDFIKDTRDASQQNLTSNEDSPATASLLSDNVFGMMRKMAKAKKPTKEGKKIPSCKLGLQPGWRKVTVIMREEHFEQLKEISYWEQISMKAIFDFVLSDFLKLKKSRKYPPAHPDDPS